MTHFKFHFLIFALVLWPCFAQVADTGTGVDGACTEASFLVGKRSYNCSSLNIGAGTHNVFKGGAGTALVIKVTGSVTINGTLDVGGANGEAGNGGDPIIGGNGGPGASVGGTCNLAGSTCGNTAGDNNGSGSGAGVGGRRGIGDFLGEASGGGGAGGSFGTVGTNGGTGAINGGTAGAGGAAGTTYGISSTWESSFVGGSGGGAGGSGSQTNDTNLFEGGAGGGGGGAIRIIAGGDITINGTLTSPGGLGGSGRNRGDAVPDDGGCGGHGSGGAIWLQSSGNIINAGSVLALGPTTVNCNGANEQGGAGGLGGNGRIRMDDDDGVIANTGAISPAATTGVASISTSGTSTLSKRNYESTLACGTIDLRDDGGPKGPLQLLIALALMFLLSYLSQRKRKV